MTVGEMVNDCGRQCFIIGGPFISEDPDCPEHGTAAKARRLMPPSEDDDGSAAEIARLVAEVAALRVKVAEVTAERDAQGQALHVAEIRHGQIAAERDTARSQVASLEAEVAAARAVVDASIAWQAAWEAKWAAPNPDDHSDADVIATGTAMRAAIKSYRATTGKPKEPG